MMSCTMVLAIGVDLIKVSRIAALVAGKNSSRFLRRVLHPSELDNLKGLTENRVPDYVAGCWAAKEAVFKTLDPETQKDFRFQDWYRYKVHGRPCIAREPPHSDEFLLSISHDNGMLVAMVLRQAQVISRKKEE